MNSKKLQPFEVGSYIGSDIAQLRSDGERPPRSARLVAKLDMGGGPGGGDYRTYLLSTNRNRSAWVLWLMGFDEKRLYCCIATGSPYRGYQAQYAAEQLLTKSWEDERDIEGLLCKNVIVDEAGLLNDQDIRRIELAVFNE